MSRDKFKQQVAKKLLDKLVKVFHPRSYSDEPPVLGMICDALDQYADNRESHSAPTNSKGERLCTK